MTEPSFADRFSRSEISRPFWDGLDNGQLRIPFCRDCSRHFFYPRKFCPSCWGPNVGWRESRRIGTVYSVSVIYRPFQGLDDNDVPCSVGLVDLDEGVRIPASFGAGESSICIGDRVMLSFDSVGCVPAFVPHAESPATRYPGTSEQASDDGHSPS